MEQLRVGQDVRFDGKAAKVMRFGVAEGDSKPTVDLQVIEEEGVRPYYERNVDPAKVKVAEAKAEVAEKPATRAKSPEALATETPNPTAAREAAKAASGRKRSAKR